MKISGLITQLEKVKTEHGDIVVTYPDFVTDGCGSGEVLSMVVRKAKSPKKGSHIYYYMRGPYAMNRTIRKNTKVVELLDDNYSEEE